MQHPEENMTYKNNVKKAIYVFMAAMLFLTFFSKTINNSMLPRVKTVAIREGKLIKEVRAEGIVQGKEIYSAYAKDVFKVEDIKVHVGEIVSKGQVLMVLDTKDLARELSDEQKVLLQKENTLEMLRAETDREIAAAKDDLDLKRKNADGIKRLYEIGAESEVNLEKAQSDLRAAERAYASALNKGDEPSQKPNPKIQNAQLDIQIQQNKIAEIQDELTSVSNVVAPAAGTIIGLNCQEGGLSDPSRPLYALTSRSGGFELIITVDTTKADFLEPGDEAAVNIPSSTNEEITGTIRGISTTSADEAYTDKKEQKDIVIDIASQALTGGERAEIYIKKITRKYQMLIPNQAVRRDKNQTCVYVLQEKKGALGQEYYIRKVSIFCEDSDDSYTAVSGGLVGDEAIVCDSDQMLSEGDRVKLMADNNTGS